MKPAATAGGASQVKQWLQTALGYLQSGKPDAAGYLFEQILAVKPDHIDALYLSGIAALQLGRPGEAAQRIERAIKANPRRATAEMHYNLGCVHLQLKAYEDAAAAFAKAVREAPRNAEAHGNLGLALQARGQLDAAIESFRRAIALKPDFVTALGNLANALQQRGEPEAAIPFYERVLQLSPGSADAYSNMGLALMEAGLMERAQACYREAIALRPDFPVAFRNLAASYETMAQFAPAAEAYRQAIALSPEVPASRSNLLFCVNYDPALSAEQAFGEYRRWNELVERLTPPRLPHDNNRDPDRRLRVGYVSPDFRQHSARMFVEPLLAHHHKGEVEVFAYAQVAKEDAVSERFKGYVEGWRNTMDLDDAALEERIRADRIDILVDLAGHTAGHRLLALARKPAPVQVSWLGFGYTTGMQAMDYFIGDPVFTPPGCEALFAEQLVRLPVFAAYRPAPGMGDPGESPASRGGPVRLGTLSRSVRLNDRVLRAWATILKALPDALLVVNSNDFRTAGMQESLFVRFAAHGIARDRIEVGYASPPWDVFRGIDLSLDCFPHNSGTTLYESLYMGVPFVTLADRPSVGRLGASLLAAIGHPEWIARDEDEYVAKVVALASGRDRLAALREGLRAQMQSSVLMDEVAFARSMEAAYRRMWQAWCVSRPGTEA